MLKSPFSATFCHEPDPQAMEYIFYRNVVITSCTDLAWRLPALDRSLASVAGSPFAPMLPSR